MKNMSKQPNIKCWLGCLTTILQTGGRKIIFGQNSSRQAHSAHSARAHTLKMQINHVVKLVNLFGCFAFAFAHAHSACEIESLGVGSTFDFIPLDSDSLGRFTSGFFEQQQPKQKNLVGLRYSGVDKLVTGYYNL